MRGVMSHESPWLVSRTASAQLLHQGGQLQRAEPAQQPLECLTMTELHFSKRLGP